MKDKIAWAVIGANGKYWVGACKSNTGQYFIFRTRAEAQAHCGEGDKPVKIILKQA